MNSCKVDNSSISVIMPVYNAEKFVSDAIKSILSQSFTDFEFIIIDDGSTDHSWDVVQSFSDNRMITVRNENNRGTYPTRNLGMKMAKGKYIAVMDADDIAMPDRLMKQYDYMERHPKLLALGTNHQVLGSDRIYKKPVSYTDICASLLHNNYVLHPSMLIQSDILRKLNGYDEKFVYASDYDLVCWLCRIGQIENLPDVLMTYRWHPDQITQAKRSEQKRYADIIRQNFQIEFINEHKSSTITSVGEYETGHPEMGEVIGLYVMGECYNPSYRNRADRLLDSIMYSITSSTYLEQCKGLSSIGSGIIYLLSNHLIDRDVDAVLDRIDDAVINSMKHYKENPDFSWDSATYYFKKRTLKRHFT